MPTARRPRRSGPSAGRAPLPRSGPFVGRAPSPRSGRLRARAANAGSMRGRRDARASAPLFRGDSTRTARRSCSPVRSPDGGLPADPGRVSSPRPRALSISRRARPFVVSGYRVTNTMRSNLDGPVRVGTLDALASAARAPGTKKTTRRPSGLAHVAGKRLRAPQRRRAVDQTEVIRSDRVEESERAETALDRVRPHPTRHRIVDKSRPPPFTTGARSPDLHRSSRRC